MSSAADLSPTLSLGTPTTDRRLGPRRYLPDCLTPFELQILELRRAGFNRIEIAQALCRSPQTVSNTLTRAKEKLGAGSLTHAAILAARRSNSDRRKSR
ncbi:MAG: helix-turn-helix transcriptional regulator [Chloroflexi bacterium]|nr:MAG: helix-turn-helix transcriptional regulator [Chloroflexota bacterium]